PGKNSISAARLGRRRAGLPLGRAAGAGAGDLGAAAPQERRVQRPGGEAVRAAHPTTSTARARSGGASSRPERLAGLRVITSSNLVGCSTGRSTGLAPFRILSTYAALRRYRSRKLVP